MVRIPVGSNVFLPACRSRAILPTLVGLCFQNAFAYQFLVVSGSIVGLLVRTFPAMFYFTLLYKKVFCLTCFLLFLTFYSVFLIFLG